MVEIINNIYYNKSPLLINMVNHNTKQSLVILNSFDDFTEWISKQIFTCCLDNLVGAKYKNIQLVFEIGDIDITCQII